MNVLITGASGFVGSGLCRALDAGGFTVQAWSRSGGAVPGFGSTRAVDFGEYSPRGHDLAGIDIVYHLGGIAHRHAGIAEYRRINAEAPAALARAALDAGVGRFVFLSSVRAMGPPASAAPRAEKDCAAVVDDPYGRAKREAEQSLVQILSGTGTSLCILRPVPVYGPGGAGNLPALLRAVRLGLPRPPAAGSRQFLSRRDLVALLKLLARAPLPREINTWIVAEDEGYSLRTVHDLARLALGLPPASDWAPLWLWRVAAAARDRLAGTAGVTTAEKLFGSELYQVNRIERDCGWRATDRLSEQLGELMACTGRGVAT